MLDDLNKSNNNNNNNLNVSTEAAGEEQHRQQRTVLSLGTSLELLPALQPVSLIGIEFSSRL